MMIDLIVAGILIVILGGAAAYVYKAKKSGKKCIGCPEGCSCGHKHGGTSCHCCDSHK